jgi:1-acyl-sn-glycerol-3-phosphate acyltransferase
MPTRSLRTAITWFLIQLATTWCRVNKIIIRLFLPQIHWDIQLPEGLNTKSWYFVISNHQSWVDILVLFYIFCDRTPFLKYFLKHELIFIPFMGMGMYALDFPFMKRYSQATLKKHPELKGKDIETTRRSCEKFREKPVAVVNFLEGTRFTSSKHRQQNSPYQNLLKPKAGGMAFTLSALGHQMSCLLDVTIFYPQGTPSFVDFCSGKVHHIIVRVHQREIPHDVFHCDYESDSSFREHFQAWTTDLWTQKDQEINQLRRIGNS